MKSVKQTTDEGREDPFVRAHEVPEAAQSEREEKPREQSFTEKMVKKKADFLKKMDETMNERRQTKRENEQRKWKELQKRQEMWQRKRESEQRKWEEWERKDREWKEERMTEEQKKRRADKEEAERVKALLPKKKNKFKSFVFHLFFV
ncbi:vicilin-like seed storage protein At2g18540 [Esox lucius]|uniref:vicilin-like seed storage protein At2g18540 n=1 Tax=Esox lucius TaxID=8010 RepID=UPI0014770000|nr:vicilin-like seed storage protein At2g18540 [Esox lucius]